MLPDHKRTRLHFHESHVVGTNLTSKVLYRILGIPVAVLILGCIPGLNLFLYSGHGGIFWLVLPLCFPYVLVRLLLVLWKLPAATGKNRLGIAASVIVIYILVAYPLTRWTEYYLTLKVGLPIRTGTMFKLATMPVGFLLPPYHSK